MMTYENPKMTKDQRDYLIAQEGHPMTWSRYHRYGDIQRYAEFLVYTYPHLVQLHTIGYSSKGLPLKVIKVSSEERGELDAHEQKPAVWIDAGMHGREWITPAVLMYVVRQLVEHYANHKRLVDTADWYFLPVANPDGYEYSHTNDRLWAKTRSDHEFSAADFASTLLYGTCEGVDMDHNFDYQWGEGTAASDEPCNDRYAGPRAVSEPETRAITHFLLDKQSQLELFISLHSYSQQWQLPLSVSKNNADYGDLMKMAKKAVGALAKVAGTKYQITSIQNQPLISSGSSNDWSKSVAGVKYSYRVELRDNGSYGYLLPATQIIPTAKETFVAIRAMAKSILCKI